MGCVLWIKIKKDFTQMEGSLQQQVKAFNILHEERVQAYRVFEEAHKAYLSTSPYYDFETFRQVVYEVTQEFKKVSEKVMEIIKSLRLSGNANAAEIIESIQDCEQKKLELTAHLQLAKQMVMENAGSELERETERDLKAKLGK